MPPAPKICLNMIVKNESRIIERCLNSVTPVINYYVICDTGSQDDTATRIKEFFSQCQIDGEIHHIPFVNFEVARNLALELCRNSAGDFDYILLADADMELFLEDRDFMRQLSEPAYLIQQSNRISYYNTRLIGRDHPARYVGVTHEYLDIGCAAPRLPGLWFYDHAFGTNRAGKSERDIKLLTAVLKQEPNNARAMFYLAQSFKDCGRYEEAIEWYQRRIALGGWEEEVWYALYMSGCCQESLGNEPEFIRNCLEAYNFRPHRAEPLYKLAGHCLAKGWIAAAIMFCKVVEDIPYPKS